jgi:hypothetical protein
MLERCSGMVNSQELPEQRSGVQKMSSSVMANLSFVFLIFLLERVTTKMESRVVQ